MERLYSASSRELLRGAQNYSEALAYKDWLT